MGFGFLSIVCIALRCCVVRFVCCISDNVALSRCYWLAYPRRITTHWWLVNLHVRLSFAHDGYHEAGEDLRQGRRPRPSFIQLTCKSWIQKIDINFFHVFLRMTGTTKQERASGKGVGPAASDPGQREYSRKVLAALAGEILRYTKLICVELSAARLLNGCNGPRAEGALAQGSNGAGSWVSPYPVSAVLCCARSYFFSTFPALNASHVQQRACGATIMRCYMLIATSDAPPPAGTLIGALMLTIAGVLIHKSRWARARRARRFERADFPTEPPLPMYR